MLRNARKFWQTNSKMVEIICKIWRLQVLSQELDKPMGVKHLKLLTVSFEETFKNFNSTEYSNTHNKEHNYTFPCIKILLNPPSTWHLAFQKRHHPGWSFIKFWSTASFPFSPLLIFLKTAKGCQKQYINTVTILEVSNQFWTKFYRTLSTCIAYNGAYLFYCLASS